MLQQWLNWRTALALFAICIVSGTIIYSNYLAKKIAEDERQKVETWVEAQRSILSASDLANLNLSIRIATENKDIPIIETNEKDSITNNNNLDTLEIAVNKHYLRNKLNEFKQLHTPIIMRISEKPYVANLYYMVKANCKKK